MCGREDLLSRPRVSAKISEYIVDFINQNLLVPLKIMQSEKFDYSLTLEFDKYLPGVHKINSVSPYTTDTKKFVTPIGFTIVDKTAKWAYLSVCTTTMNETIEPKEYAILAYELVGSFLIKNFKRIKKETLNNFMDRIDFTLIESFPFPAPFEEQKYSLDDATYMLGWESDYATKEEQVWVTPAVDYKKHYGF